MTGMEMLLKSMGIDKGELMARADQFQDGLRMFVAASERIEKKIDALAVAVDALQNAAGGPRNLTLPDDALLGQFAKGIDDDGSARDIHAG
jgi:hypothetical protein